MMTVIYCAISFGIGAITSAIVMTLIQLKQIDDGWKKWKFYDFGIGHNEGYSNQKTKGNIRVHELFKGHKVYTERSKRKAGNNDKDPFEI